MDGVAVVLCEGAYNTTCGKTAHGLVRHTDRYRIVAVIDSTAAGADAGEMLDGRSVGIPVVPDLRAALAAADGSIDFLVVGIATHGGVLPEGCRPIVREALAVGINVDSGLHQLLSDDPEFAAAARRSGARIRDVRRTPPRAELHSFSGEVARIDSLRLAVLGTDSGVGKRTTALRLVQGINATGARAELIGTGQTSWLQGVKYGILLDSLINDFVSGEIEHQVLRAFRERRPDVIVVEGQGALTNPAYPGGFEIIAGARPDGFILQHAPARLHYDGFPEYPLAGVEKEKHLIELLSGRPVIAIALNHHGSKREEMRRLAAAYRARFGVACCDPLIDGVDAIIAAIRDRFPRVPR